MKYLKPVSLSIITALAAIASPVIAYADAGKADSKIYPGLGCREIPDGVVVPDNPNITGEDDVRYNSAGWAFNASTDHGIVVACPIVREHDHKPMKRAWVVVNNQTKENVVCQIEAFDESGFWLEESSDFVFPPNFKSETVFISNDKDDNDFGPILLGDSNVVPTLSNKDGYFVLLCFLPAATPKIGDDGAPTGTSDRYAFVVRYRVDEVYN